MYKCLRRNCELEWEYDPLDGKCPVCRERLVPKSMWKHKEPGKIGKVFESFINRKRA